jgi:tRNA nucleotidyltransferase (CCA-adding enzyme)
MAKQGWEHFPHGADIGIRGRGATIEKAFEQAGRALTAILVDPESVQPVKAVDLICSAPDTEILLVDWLNALIYEMASRQMLFGRFRVTIDDNRLHATAWGERIDHGRHAPTVETKGATFTELRVALAQTGEWVAQCVIDV